MSDKPRDEKPESGMSKEGEPRGGSPSRVRATNPRRRSGAPRRLSQTRGPEPATPLDEVKLAIGTIGGTHGVRGELKLKLLTDQPEHLTTIRRVFLGSSDQPTQVTGLRLHGGDALISLAGIDNPEDGKKLGGLTVRIAGSDAKPLEEGEYFLFQLIGLRAETEDGTAVGEVTDLLETGAHDVLVIQPARGGEDILIPNHPEYVVATEPEAGRIVVRVPVYRD
jgi:16S rRNA processing protein RimM